MRNKPTHEQKWHQLSQTAKAEGLTNFPTVNRTLKNSKEPTTPPA
jgi:hypothetical protein